jgi:hypothetical protein
MMFLWTPTKMWILGLTEDPNIVCQRVLRWSKSADPVLTFCLDSNITSVRLLTHNFREIFKYLRLVGVR